MLSLTYDLQRQMRVEIENTLPPITFNFALKYVSVHTYNFVIMLHKFDAVSCKSKSKRRENIYFLTVKDIIHIL